MYPRQLSAVLRPDGVHRGRCRSSAYRTTPTAGPETEVAMSLPDVVSREEWLAERQQLLIREKELTRQRDILNADRRRLPMVRVDKEYKFEGPQGAVSLLDLFEGSDQL